MDEKVCKLRLGLTAVEFVVDLINVRLYTLITNHTLLVIYT